MTGHGKSKDMQVSGEGPWNDFIQTLENLGCSIVKESEAPRIDAVIANSYSRDLIKIANKFNVSKDKMICVIWEPKIVDPRRYTIKNLNNYGTIFCPSPLWAKGSNIKYFNWPQMNLKKNSPNFVDWEKRRNRSVMIAANKFSVNNGELYSLRRRLSILNSLKDSMDLYGYGWNQGFFYDLKLIIVSLVKSRFKIFKLRSISGIGKIHQSYIGSVDDKLNKLQEYRINIVIENSSDYISEKLFDSVASGAITIYVGPKLQIFGLVDGIALTVAPDENDISKLIDQLLELPVNEQKKLAQKQWETLLPFADSWEGSKSLTSLARNIHNQLTQHKG
jgi:hypothetical protein